MNFQTIHPPVVTEQSSLRQIEIRMPTYNFEEVFNGRASAVLIDRMVEPLLGDRLRIIEVGLQRVMRTDRICDDEWCTTGRDCTALVTNITMGTVQEALVSFKLHGRTWHARNEQDIHQRKPVPYPMRIADEGVAQ